jgi:hypothetical protein
MEENYQHLTIVLAASLPISLVHDTKLIKTVIILMLISDTNLCVNDDYVIVFKHVYLFTVSNGNLQQDF